jgi:hypothetical protein
MTEKEKMAKGENSALRRRDAGKNYQELRKRKEAG